MKSEWRDLFNLPPVLLYKADLFALEKVLCASEEGITSEFRIQLTNKTENIEISSFEELFTYSNLSVVTDKLKINCHNWKAQGESRDIVSGVSLTLHHSYADCQIYSRNEEWLIGKREKIKSFFVSKKPWYSIITRNVPFILPILILIPFQNLVLSLGKKDYPSVVFYFFLLFAFLILGYLSFRMLLFPYIRIVLREKNKNAINWDFVFNVVVALSAVLVIIDYIFKWVLY